jgi:hypothetical protein
VRRTEADISGSMRWFIGRFGKLVGENRPRGALRSANLPARTKAGIPLSQGVTRGGETSPSTHELCRGELNVIWRRHLCPPTSLLLLPLGSVRDAWHEHVRRPVYASLVVSLSSDILISQEVCICTLRGSVQMVFRWCRPSFINAFARESSAVTSCQPGASSSGSHRARR